MFCRRMKRWLMVSAGLAIFGVGIWLFSLHARALNDPSIGAPDRPAFLYLALHFLGFLMMVGGAVISGIGYALF